MVGREGQQKPWTQGLPLQSWSLALHAGRTGHAERVVLASIGLLSIWGPQMASTPIPGYKTKAKPHLVYHGFMRENSSTPSGIWSSRGESQPQGKRSQPTQEEDQKSALHGVLVSQLGNGRSHDSGNGPEREREHMRTEPCVKTPCARVS